MTDGFACCFPPPVPLGPWVVRVGGLIQKDDDPRRVDRYDLSAGRFLGRLDLPPMLGPIASAPMARPSCPETPSIKPGSMPGHLRGSQVKPPT